AASRAVSSSVAGSGQRPSSSAVGREGAGGAAGTASRPTAALRNPPVCVVSAARRLAQPTRPLTGRFVPSGRDSPGGGAVAAGPGGSGALVLPVRSGVVVSTRSADSPTRSTAPGGTGTGPPWTG